jgi:signal transduction histidine kinase
MIIQGTHRYVNVAAAISIAVLLVAVSTLAAGIQRTAESWRSVIHTREVLQHVQGAESLINEADALQKSLRLEHDSRDRAQFQARLTEIPREVGTLTRLTRDNPVQQRTLAGFRRQLDEYTHDLLVGLERNTPYPSKDREQAMRRTIAAQVDALQDEEERLLAQREATVATDRTRVIAAAGAVSVLAVALLLFVRAMARRDADFLAAERANLDTTLRSIGEAVIAVDAFGRVRFMNRVAERLLGCDEARARTQPLTTVFRIAASRADDEALTSTLRTVLAERRPVTGVPLAGSGPGEPETVREWLLNCHPLAVDGHVLGAVMSMLDVTDLKRAQRELGEANLLLERRIRERTAQLDDANTELRAFAHTIAHDLRAPLRNVQGYADALLEDEAGNLSGSSRAYLTRIRAVTQRMDRLVSDLLAYSQLSRAELRLQAVDLGRVLRLALQDLDAQIRASGAHIDCAAPLPAALGNEGVLVQIFANLLGNAIKFVPPGARPGITVSARLEDDAVIVDVVDDGIGIPADKRDRVFDVFERLHGEEQYQGTGIGLAIVKKGVERLGGSVSAEPAARGTVLRLRLRRPPESGGGAQDAGMPANRPQQLQ